MTYDCCVCPCLVPWVSIGAPRSDPVSVLLGWCVWSEAPDDLALLSGRVVFLACCATDRGCLNVLPCRLGQSCSGVSEKLWPDWYVLPRHLLRHLSDLLQHLRHVSGLPIARRSMPIWPGRLHATQSQSVTSAAESSADAPVMALVIQDWKSVARAPSVLDALDVFRARPAGRRLISSRTCELWIVVNPLHAPLTHCVINRDIGWYMYRSIQKASIL